MASDHFIDPILQQVRGAGGAALVGTANILVDSEAQEAADLTANHVIACLPALHIGASSMSSVFQAYNNEKRSLEETPWDRRSGVGEQTARRSGRNLERLGQEPRYLLADHSNRQELSMIQNEPQVKQSRERTLIEAVIYDLEDRVSLYRDILRQYADDPSRWAGETKIFQRDIGIFLKKLSNTMFRGHISLNAMRVWANGAAFHIQINSYMTNAGLQTTESFFNAVEIHRETARNLCSEYWRSNQLQSTVVEIREVEKYFHCSSNCVEHPTNKRVTVNTLAVAGSSNEVGDETTEIRGHENEAPEWPKFIWVALCAIGVISAIIYVAKNPSQLDQTRI